jgi:hypothetical protein
MREHRRNCLLLSSAGGFYHGTLTFPAQYPYKPPAIAMITPNGRFKTNTRLCLSMSDFHPETWNPLWSVSRCGIVGVAHALLFAYAALFRVQHPVGIAVLHGTEPRTR